MGFQIRPVFLMVLLALGLAFSAIAQQPGPTPPRTDQLTPEQSKRLYELEHEFMSPCCYGEALYGHMSPTAQEMKTEIAQMIVGGQSDREIVEFFKGKYGERILTEPEGTQWWVMNIVPFALLGLGLLITVFVIRRMLRPAEPRAA
ncbi:MAG: cytochrome c-type biogenesis protein CcmH [Bryobacterales bacterium]|nr:cytochrome c-type biogenesis protein CcmH [Bryobacterales bacterium]